MELTAEQRTEIEKIASEVNCPKNFECYKSEDGMTCKCKTRDFGLSQYLDCLENEPESCEFALPFGNGHFCTCPVQLYISKNLKQQFRSFAAEGEATGEWK
ncbi:MAG: hypothetical protein PHY02_04100 [Phycisphaerae bacterium]|nr:hypothetical protein [Phycisphaerae bacterium]